MQKLAIIHFLPIEYYPPVTNFLSFLNSKKILCKTYTTHNTKNREPYANSQIEIIRYRPTENGKTKISRILWYYAFNIKTLVNLIRFKPDVVLYYDTFSSMPAYWYFKYFGRNTKLWIHSHEYYSKEIYKKATLTINYYHQKEVKYLYQKATGISQTNPTRIRLFREDNPYLNPEKLHVIPNYPPKNWHKQEESTVIHSPIKIIYVGGLSIKNSYIKPFCEWVIQNNGKMIFDIYSYFIDAETTEYLLSLHSKFINYIKGGTEYNRLPDLFDQYDIGLILFRDFDENYRFNETNKLFEYLACNLDVWFSSDLQGIMPHVTTNTYPKVINIDFNHLQKIQLKALISREAHSYKNVQYHCESVFEGWYSKIID